MSDDAVDDAEDDAVDVAAAIAGDPTPNDTDNTTATTFVSAVAGAKANLTAEAELTWTGASILKNGNKVQLTIAGGASDAATVCDVVVKTKVVTDNAILTA